MLKIAGQRLDLYDDAELETLRSSMDPGDLRKLAANTTILEPGELDALEDADFGAVLFEGPEKTASRRRAWPCHDPENTTVSLVYFKHAADAGWMPEEIRNQVACQLVAQADYHEIDVDDGIRKWAELHGEWLPGDNFIDLALYDVAAQPAPTKFALEKIASGERLGYYPCGTPDEVAASMSSLVNDGADVFGLTDFEGRKVAAILRSEATDLGVEVPDEIVAMSQIEKRSSQEIHGLLRYRVERVPEAKREKLASAIDGAIAEIESEEDPIKMARNIQRLDEALGFHAGHYETGIPTPLDTVFRKVAVEELRPTSLLDKIGRERIEDVCGAEKLAEFEKDAQAAFDSCEPEVQELLLHGAE